MAGYFYMPKRGRMTVFMVCMSSVQVGEQSVEEVVVFLVQLLQLFHPRCEIEVLLILMFFQR